MKRDATDTVKVSRVLYRVKRRIGTVERTKQRAKKGERELEADEENQQYNNIKRKKEGKKERV